METSMKRWCLALAMLSIVGCKKPEPTATATTKTVPVTQKDLGSALPIDHPPIDPPPTKSPSRQPRRLSVSQLRASMPVAMGIDENGEDVFWNAGTTQKPVDGFDSFSRTLGEADFVNTTEDNLEPSPIYVKFMDDAARSTCDQALVADAAQGDVSKRTIIRYVALTDTPSSNPEGFNKALKYLKLRFHGIKVSSDTEVDPLRTLFTTAGQGTSKPITEGWRAVCVALLTAPEFHVY